MRIVSHVQTPENSAALAFNARTSCPSLENSQHIETEHGIGTTRDEACSLFELPKMDPAIICHWTTADAAKRYRQSTPTSV
jgi:hypothetical protein